jgi:hypothetical protein
MHPLRRLRESGKPTAAQVSEPLAENIVFNSPILIRPIEGRESSRRSSLTRGLRVVSVPIRPSLSSMSTPPSCAGWEPWMATDRELGGHRG